VLETAELDRLELRSKVFRTYVWVLMGYGYSQSIEMLLRRFVVGHAGSASMWRTHSHVVSMDQ